MSDLMNSFVEIATQFGIKFPLVMILLSSLGTLVVIGQAVVALTPTKKDDQILDMIEKNSVWDFIIEFLKKFAVIQKK